MLSEATLLSSCWFIVCCDPIESFIVMGVYLHIQLNGTRAT